MIKLIRFIRWYFKYDYPVYLAHIKSLYYLQYKKSNKVKYFDLFKYELLDTWNRETFKHGKIDKIKQD